ncbi:puromycin-sensitive aminopeptidase-like protein isoform X2 [Tanacetum coccineum]
MERYIICSSVSLLCDGLNRIVTRRPLVFQLHKIDNDKEYVEFLHLPSNGNLIDQGNLEQMHKFYTVYEKEAEVVRMYKTLLGSEGFWYDLYFQRHEGEAVTCEDFFAAM